MTRSLVCLLRRTFWYPPFALLQIRPHFCSPSFGLMTTFLITWHFPTKSCSIFFYSSLGFYWPFSMQTACVTKPQPTHFNPVYVGSTFFWNINIYLQDNTLSIWIITTMKTPKHTDSDYHYVIVSSEDWKPVVALCGCGWCWWSCKCTCCLHLQDQACTLVSCADSDFHASQPLAKI
jgi:hypothetical protein